MSNVVKTTAIFSSLLLALTGCEQVEQGTDNGFSNQAPVSYTTDSIQLSFDEVSGQQSVDLLAGAAVNGEPLTLENATSTIYIRDFLFASRNEEFVTPQTAGFANNQNISPFTLGEDGVSLLVDTDAFADALRLCDPQDKFGAEDEEGNPTGNGIRDYPTSITYDIQYVIDNGYEYPIGEQAPVRNLTLTINAISDPVTGVEAFDVDVASGDSTQMLAATSPSYACNAALSYQIADTSYASIDDMGVIAGLNKGETSITVTSVENPALSASAALTVTPGFNLAITNQQFNDLGAPLGTKLVPTCSEIGISVAPSIVADELTGAYSYAWSADPLAFNGEESDGQFGATGRFTNPLATGESATITVGYDSGYTGSTQAADIPMQQVTVTAERNYACDPLPNADGAVWYASDLLLNSGNWGAEATHVGDSLDGMALQLTSTDNGAYFGKATQQQWNQTFNFHAATYGRGEASIGRTFKFAVWAKLGQLPSEAVRLEHTLLPWNCQGCEGAANFPDRYELGVQGSVSATLQATTDWQLVEFINPLTGTNEWSVPSHWNVPTILFQFWDLYGLADGETILLDQYSVVEVTEEG